MPALTNVTLHGQIVTIFGGTGFVGRHIIAALVAAGARVKVATRHKNSAYLLRLYGSTGQVVPVSVSYKSEDSVDAAIAGSSMVINCLGILQESGKNNLFAHVHNDIPLWMARSCTKRHIARFIHISALGVDYARSRYAISKIKGEFAVTSVYPATTILRPSVIFGSEDSFFNRFAALTKISPVLPLIGGGHTRFQPVYVGDVAKAALVALANPQTAGHIYELGGPEVLNFKDILERLLSVMKTRRCLITLPWWAARVQAFCMSILPTPPLTNDQITSLQSDSIVGSTQKNFAHLGIKPEPIDAVLPLYISPVQ